MVQSMTSLSLANGFNENNTRPFTTYSSYFRFSLDNTLLVFILPLQLWLVNFSRENGI